MPYRLTTLSRGALILTARRTEIDGRRCPTDPSRPIFRQFVLVLVLSCYGN